MEVILKAKKKEELISLYKELISDDATPITRPKGAPGKGLFIKKDDIVSKMVSCADEAMWEKLSNMDEE